MCGNKSRSTVELSFLTIDGAKIGTKKHPMNNCFIGWEFVGVFGCFGESVITSDSFDFCRMLRIACSVDSS